MMLPHGRTVRRRATAPHSTALRRLAVLVGTLVLAGLGIGAPATDAHAGVLRIPVDPMPSGPDGAPYKPGRGVLGTDRAVRRPAEVSVMSFNVCGGACRRGEVARTAAYTARTAVTRHASVVLLQELCYSQFLRVRSLLATRGYSAEFAAATRSTACDDDDHEHGRGFGVAVLVRGASHGRVVKPLPTPSGVEKRLMLGVTADVGGRSTFVAVVHLSPSPAAGLERQLAVVARYLNPKASRPLIVGGDFNSLPDNPGLSRFYSAAVGGTGRFIEADETRTGRPVRGGAATFDTAARKIDYIFLSDEWFRHPRAKSLATTMSDHHVYIGTARVTGD
jgi:endonuclease/exonuclease/phosphatase family metal-dependent hydrolase